MVHNVLQTIAEMLVVLSYTFVVLVITTSKAKVFKNAFYSIFLATGIADIASLFSCCFIRLNRELGLNEDFETIVVICLTASAVAFAAHMIGNVLIAVNRYTAICLSKKYDVIWTRKRVWTAVFIQYVVSLLAFIHIAGTKMLYIHNNDGTVILKGFQKHVELIVRSTYVGACTVYAIVCLSVNARLLFEWNRLSQSGGLKQSHHERSLFVYTILVFICSILLCTQQVAKAIATFTNNDGMNLWVTAQ
ncbi:hypothetical protein COOONC_07743, partial [Cooperia oncophora]